MKLITLSNLSLNKFLNLILNLLLILNLFFLLSFESCKSPTAPKSYRLSLSVSDVSCTEAWIKLTVNNAPLPANVVIKRNGNNLFSFNLTSSDTTVYDSTLLPNQTYTYQAAYGKAYPTETSQTVTAKTMDTTSNNFTWQTIVLGDGLNNYFNDVAVVSDTSIWVVGKFNLQDSIGMFNVMHWDGIKWNPFHLTAIDSSGNPLTPELRGILYFSENDIWFAGGSIFHWDGKKFSFSLERYTYFNGGSETVDRLWGNSDQNIYGVGSLGTIVKNDGKSWQQIQSGTTLNIQDIWGANDPITGKEQILCIASNVLSLNQNVLIQIKDGSAHLISNQGLPPYYFSSVWFKNSNLAYVTGNGTYKSYNFFNNTGWITILPLITTYYSYSIRGNDVNDIFFCGSYGDLAHYNGVHWYDYLGKELQTFNGNLYGFSVKGNTVCAVGAVAGNKVQAVIILGRRNN